MSHCWKTFKAQIRSLGRGSSSPAAADGLHPASPAVSSAPSVRVRRPGNSESTALPDPLVISIDAMGGDHGPTVVAPGVLRAAKLFAPGSVRFLLHGDASALNGALHSTHAITSLCEIRHTETTVAMDAKPGHAMRRGKGTSMWKRRGICQNG